MEVKTCNRCNTEKPIDDFYKQADCRGGRMAKCKKCHKEYHKDLMAEGRAITSSESSKKYRANNVKKRKAHNKVWAEITAGRIVKAEKCEECPATENIHAHHDDYDKPLDVRWLCRACHAKWHFENGEAKNAA